MRGDFGFDVPLEEEAEPLVRANFGLGWAAAGSFALTAELVSVGTLAELSPGADRFTQNVTFGARVHGDTATGFFGVSVPFGDLRPDPRLTLTAGLQYHF